MKGRLIVIDGLDEAGKQTQAALLLDRFARAGVPARGISFPDYTHPSSALVKQYLAGEFGQADDVPAYAASSFYAVDRFASYVGYWKDDYLAGHTIIADRYATSNLIHQMGKLPRGQWDAFIDWSADFEYEKLGLPKPDAVLFLDMHPDVSERLLMKRYGGDAAKKDIHEANAAYMRRCRVCALYAAERCGWSMVRCSDGREAFSPAAIAECIWKVLMDGNK